jgi:hypothetical protein
MISKQEYDAGMSIIHRDALVAVNELHKKMLDLPSGYERIKALVDGMDAIDKAKDEAEYKLLRS